MRTFIPPAGTRFDAGVALHARAAFVVIRDRHGTIAFARHRPARPDAFPAPSRPPATARSSPARAGTAGTGSPTPAAPAPSPSSAARRGHDGRPRPEGHVRPQGRRGHRPAAQGRQPPARLRRSRTAPRPARPLPRPPPPRPPARPAVRPRPHRPPPGQPAAGRQRRQVPVQARRRRRRQRRPLRPPPRRDAPGPARTARHDHPPPIFEWPRRRERMRIGTGRGAVPGTAARPRGVGPPESAGALGAARPRPAGPEPTPALDSQAGARRHGLTSAAVNPGAEVQKSSPFQGRAIIVS
jgi:translation initiation factor IF-2